MDYDYLFKLLIIGDSGVGKSSILLRFTDDIFTESHISTIGVDFKINTIEIDKNIIKLQIWDTAGQERFKNITSSYYKGAQGVIIVFDVTNKESFNNVKYWISELTHYNPDMINCILIGNKSDKPNNRKVDYNEAKLYADSLNIKYIETSAKNNTNVDKIFNLLVEDILELFNNKKINYENELNNSIIIDNKENINKKCC